jgi:hypothetical protein
LKDHIERKNILDEVAASHFRDIDDFIETRNQTEIIPDFIKDLIYKPRGTLPDFILVGVVLPRITCANWQSRNPFNGLLARAVLGATYTISLGWKEPFSLSLRWWYSFL